jgi:hypothetical protein
MAGDRERLARAANTAGSAAAATGSEEDTDEEKR